MIKEDIPFSNGKGMHVARIESPAAGYALYLLRLGIQEDEDSMDDCLPHDACFSEGCIGGTQITGFNEGSQQMD